jgi:MFS family permease
MRSGLLPLKRRLFSLFWGAGLISDAGTWLQLVTIGTLVAADTGKATKTALIAAATFAPQGIGSPLGGILADRYDRRHVLLRTLGLQTVVTMVLAVLLAAGERNPIHLAIVMLFQSAAGALGQPSFQAIIPDLVPREEVQAAVALGLTSWNTGRVLGPALAGVFLVAGLGPAWAVGANAVTFAVLWVAVLFARKTFLPVAVPTDSVLGELRAGAATLWRTPGCRFTTTTYVFLHFTLIPFMGLIPKMALDVLGGTKRTVSVLTSVQGLAAIAAALTVTTLLQRWSRSTLYATFMAASAAASVLYVTSSTVLQASIGIACLGASVSVIFAVTGGMLQRDAPSAKRGRVLSLNSAISGTTYGIGLLTLGWLVDHSTMATVFVVGAGVQAAAAIAFRASGKLRSIVDGHSRVGRSELLAAA